LPDLPPEWNQYAEQLDALRRARILQAGIERAILVLSDPQCSRERLDVQARFVNSVWLTARGHKDLPHVARMDFVEVLNDAAIEVREGRATLSEAASIALDTCARGLPWSRYWY